MTQLSDAEKPAESSMESVQPNRTFGPFGVLIVVPWLLMAAIVRIPAFAYTGSRLNLFFLISDMLIFFAFLAGAERLIHLTGGVSRLRSLGFDEKLELAKRVYIPMSVLCFTLSLLATGIGNLTPGAPEIDGRLYFLRGFDGMAFDQMMTMGQVWSAILAAVLFTCIIERDQGRALTIPGVSAALYTHAMFLLVGVGVSTLFLIGLSGLQSMVRTELVGFLASDSSLLAKNLAIVVFAASFAVVRLITMLTILALCLRASFRRQN